MSEQFVRKYNLQPLSPNAIGAPPMQDYANAAQAALLNRVGSPAGLQTSPHVEALNARLRTMSEQAAAEGSVAQSRVRAAQGMRGLDTALAADKQNLGQSIASTQLAAQEAAKNDFFNIVPQYMAAASGFANLTGTIADKLAPGTESDYVYGDDGLLQEVKPKPSFAYKAVDALNKALSHSSPALYSARKARLQAKEYHEKALSGIASPDEIRAMYEARLESMQKRVEMLEKSGDVIGASGVASFGYNWSRLFDSALD